jgi:hypothetical protein
VRPGQTIIVSQASDYQMDMCAKEIANLSIKKHNISVTNKLERKCTVVKT